MESDSFIFKYKNGVIALILVLILGLIGYGIDNKRRESAEKKWNGLIYQYTIGPLKDFSEGKLEAQDLALQFENLIATIGSESYRGMAPALMNTVRALYEKEKYPKALELLKKKGKALAAKNNPYLSYFLSSHLTMLYEDMGKDEEAILILERMASGQMVLMKDKIHLDLGRLYLKVKNTSKAKLNFQYVVDNSKQREFTKLANIYLTELNANADVKK